MKKAIAKAMAFFR